MFAKDRLNAKMSNHPSLVDCPVFMLLPHDAAVISCHQECLGSGACSSVYRARQGETPVALKSLGDRKMGWV